MRAGKFLPQFRSQGGVSFPVHPPPSPNPETLTSTCQLHPLGLSQQSPTFQAFFPDIIPFDLYNLPLKCRGQVSLLPFYEWGNGDHRHRVKPWAAKPPPCLSILGKEYFIPVLETIASCPQVSTEKSLKRFSDTSLWSTTNLDPQLLFV